MTAVPYPLPDTVGGAPGPWADRFTFYYVNGRPGHPQYRVAYRALSFGQRMRLGSNIWAFLFGPFYFMAKGMWRKGVTLLAIGLAIGAVLALIGLSRFNLYAGIGLASFQMTIANYQYFLHVVHGNRSWNPIDGMKMW